MSTPIRLPLSPRQAEALAVALGRHGLGSDPRCPDADCTEHHLTPDGLRALREVAGKLDTLREK